VSDESKAVVRRFIEGYQSGHNEQVALECLADDFVTVRDGQMREHWNVVDALTLMTQLGVVPSMG
jgi:predicted ester cyclase